LRDRPPVRELALLESRQEYDLELQSFRRMEGHQLDGVPLALAAETIFERFEKSGDGSVELRGESNEEGEVTLTRQLSRTKLVGRLWEKPGPARLGLDGFRGWVPRSRAQALQELLGRSALEK
jgi:hypothetical protein